MRVLGAVAAAGLAADLALRSGVTCLAGTLVVLVAACGLAATGRLRNPQAFAMAGLACVFGAFLAVRSSPLLILIDVLAAAVLLALAASYARGGSVLDGGLPALVTRGFDALGHVPRAGAFVARSVPGSWQRRDSAPAVLRGALLALPVLVVCGALLASGDAVFARLIRVRFDPATVASHLVPFAFAGWGMASLLLVASSHRAADARVPRLGSVEAIVVLGGLDALFGLFAASQAVTVAGGARHVLQTAGLTYAEWARGGFFQLLGVAAITLVVLLAVRACAERTTALMVLSEVAVALTLVLVGVAARRLLLYVDAYGFTMLRLVSLAFAGWVALVFAMLAGALVHSGVRRDWLPFAAGCAAVTIAALLNVANAEAFVVAHNVTHAEATGRFDAAYVWDLSDDATPALVHALPTLESADRERVRAHLCRGYPAAREFSGWAAFSVSGSRAAQARSAACTGR